MNGVSQNQGIRRSTLHARLKLSPAEVTEYSQRICQTILGLPAWEEAQNVMLYFAIRNEVDTTLLFTEAWRLGKHTWVPTCVRSRGNEVNMLDIREVSSFDQVREATFGIREPWPELPIGDPTVLDIVFVPGVAFDTQGARLGYGAGYYDRFLLRCRLDVQRIAPVFRMQLSPTPLWQGEHDQQVHMLIDEQGCHPVAGNPFFAPS